MKYDPNKHNRQSLRLKGYDYSLCGAYFITMCVQNRECIFGNIENGKMILNDAGKMVDLWWQKLGDKFINVGIDEYIIMPDHMHGVIFIYDGETGQTQRSAPTDLNSTNSVSTDSIFKDIEENKCIAGENKCVVGANQCVRPNVPKMVQWYKTMTTNEYIRNVKQKGWPPFNGKLWQRNYYEHIIRNDESLNRIIKYIANNPSAWVVDCRPK